MHVRRSRRMTIVLIGLTVIILVLLVVVFGFLSGRDRHMLFARSKTFSYAGEARTYRLYVPNEITKDTPLIMGLHGFGDSSQRFAYYTGLHNAAESAVIVYPDSVTPNREGLKTGWNAGFCCGAGWVNKADDVGFLAELATSLAKEFGISDKRVYVTGFSNGGFMAQRLAAERPDVFRAAAIGSGTIGTTERQIAPTQPVPILLMHGTNDTTVSFAGGPGNDPNFDWLSFAQTRAVWEQVNGDSAPVETKVYEGNGHSWNDWRIGKVWHKTPEASQRVVTFFEQQNK